MYFRPTKTFNSVYFNLLKQVKSYCTYISANISPQLELWSVVFLLKFDARRTYSVDANLTNIAFLIAKSNCHAPERAYDNYHC